MEVILAPHLDDEVLGCFSVLSRADRVVYFTRDKREASIRQDRRYTFCAGVAEEVMQHETLSRLTASDVVYLPSQYDLHPWHHRVRQLGLSLPGQKMFYSVSMTVPWLEEEEHPEEKRELFARLYPSELHYAVGNDQWFLFKSIKPYDHFVFREVCEPVEGGEVLVRYGVVPLEWGRFDHASVAQAVRRFLKGRAWQEVREVADELLRDIESRAQHCRAEIICRGRADGHILAA